MDGNEDAGRGIRRDSGHATGCGIDRMRENARGRTRAPGRAHRWRGTDEATG